MDRQYRMQICCFYYTNRGTYIYIYIYIFVPGQQYSLLHNCQLLCYNFSFKFSIYHFQITQVLQTSHTDFEIKLSSNQIAPYVWLDAYKVKGRFSDNGFLMIKRQASISFSSWEPVDLTTFKASLTVKSLLDVYHHIS